MINSRKALVPEIETVSKNKLDMVIMRYMPDV